MHGAHLREHLSGWISYLSDCRAGHLGVSSWEYGVLGELIAIPATRFLGVFALFDVPMSYGRYWVTVALDSVSPERDVDDEN